MKKYIICSILVSVIFSASYGQSEKDLKGISTEANKQKTANSKDIFTSLYRAGINNLLGDDHTFSFSSSFFGIDSIFRKKGTTLEYEKERKMRQKSFNIGITGDSNNSITKLSGGFTFTLINKKDITKKFEDGDTKKLQNISLFVSEIKKKIIDYVVENYIEKIYNQDEYKGQAKRLKDSVKTVINNSWNNAAKKHDFSNLHPYIKEALGSVDLESEMTNSISVSSIYSQTEIMDITKSYVQGKDFMHKVYVDIAEKYARKLLWTFTPDFIYDRVNKQAGFSFASDLTFGLGKNYDKKPWEFEIKTTFKIENDTSVNKTNYRNNPFSFSVGINKVLLENEDKESKMEFKFLTQYDYQFGNVPVGIDAGIFTLNSTLRINVYRSLWLPLTLKYDPVNNNFLGIFAVTANLGN